MKLHRQRFRHSVVLAVSLHIFIITVRNEVAKVMFLHVSVILSTGGCLVLGGLLPGGCLVLGVGVPGIPACTEADPPGETATAAHGTHPTGMHSCYKQVTTN